MARKRDSGSPAMLTCEVTGQRVETTTNEQGEPHLPIGWKRLGGTYVSREGMQQRYTLRCLTVPVERVVSGYDATIPEADTTSTSSDWKAFKLALATSWRAVTQCSNWILQRLAALDTEPLEGNGKGGSKLPKFAPDTKPLYALIRQQWPDLDSQSMGQVLQNVKSRYMQGRFDFRVRGALSLPTYRYPTPLPCPAKDSPLYLDERGRVCLRLRIAGQRFAVRLKSDPKRFGRQMAPLIQAARGELVRGDVKIREGGDGQVLIAVSVYLPRQVGLRDNPEAFLVRTDPAALLVGEIQGRNAFVLNADEVRRWQAAHASYLQRMSQDRKAERRGRLGYTEEDSRKSRKQHARNTQRALETRCAKHDRRMSDALHKLACTVANHAQRRQVGTVIYDDEERTYMERFPYARLKTLIKEKLEARGIVLIAREVTEQDEDGKAGRHD